jgi:molybdate transport system ATP-binding protein
VSVDAAVRVAIDTFELSAELHVGDGEMLAVLGPNAAGKTTMLRVLAGLLPLDEGHVCISGTVVDDPAARVFVPPEQRSIGVVFQDYLLFGHLDARDNIAFGLRERGVGRTEARARADTLIDLIGLSGRATARPRELSGGQAQRVALARALATEPRLLLLDEPLAALDVQTRADTRRQMRELLAGFEGTRVLVTHDPVDALALADRILILEHGKVVQVGTPDEITTRPRSQYVADLVGVNLLRGRATGDGGLVAVGELMLTSADSHTGEVLVIFPPTAVVLHRTRPESSARNTWPGTVVGVEHFGTRRRVRVQVSDAVAVIAEVTPAAVSDLALAEGTPVWVAVKATELEVFPI